MLVLIKALHYICVVFKQNKSVFDCDMLLVSKVLFRFKTCKYLR